MKKTKIIATIGPASKEYDIIKKLIENGTDVFRFNLSHASYDFCKDIIEKINQANKELNTYSSIMFDLEGPGIRIGKIIGGDAFLKQDDKIRIYMKDVIGDSTKFSVDYKNLIKDVKFNSIIKINDGHVELQVIDKGIGYIICKVIKEGVITSNCNLNVIDIEYEREFLSSKDKEDILFASEMNVDYLALSHVRNSDDVLAVNDLLIEIGDDNLSIIAKIENESAVNDIDSIIRSSDGVMIARGDLGVSIPMERVPGIQKTIINKCHIMGKISIVATELISSMERQTRPTRAEVSDIANAVLDGVDAIMLSGETTVGKYPVETLVVMEKIITSAELDINYLELLDKAMRTEKQDTTGLIAYSVTECSNRLKAKAIVTPTISGYTARKISRFRPSCPIIAVCTNIETIKNLNLYFGVKPVLIEKLDNLDDIIKESRTLATKLIKTEFGDKIIITGAYPFNDVKHTNFMEIEEL